MMGPDSRSRGFVALAVLAVLALAAWLTMEHDKYFYLVWVLLGFSAFRVVMTLLRARYSNSRVVAELDHVTTRAGSWERKRNDRLPL